MGQQLGITNINLDNKGIFLGVSHNNLSAYVYSLNNSALGVSINNETSRLNNLTTSSAQSLTRNETTLPSSFTSSSLTSLGRQINPVNITNNIDSIGTFNLGVSGNKVISLAQNSLSVNPNSAVSITGNCYVNGPISNNIYYNQNIAGQPLYNYNSSWITNNSYMPLQVIQPIMSTQAQNQDPKPVLSLGRPAKSGDTYAGSFIFNVCKTDNTVGSFNRLDINSDYANSSGTPFYPTLMSLRYDGNIGIGTTNPSANLDVNGTALIRNNLTVSGTLQSPLTSLLSVSSSVIDGKVSTFLGTSYGNITSIPMGISTMRYQNNITDKIIMYQDASGNIGFGVTNNKLVIHTNDNSTNISIGTNSSGSVFTGYREKVLIQDATTLITNNLTVSGTLQSPLTSLIGVSLNAIDNKVNTGIIGNIWGTTSTEKQINYNSYVLINNGDGNNSYLRFGNSGNKISLIGQINGASNGDLFLRQASSGSKTYFQNSSSSNIMTLDNTGVLNVASEYRQTIGSDSVWLSVFSNDGHINSTNNMRLYSNNGVLGLKLLSNDIEAHKPIKFINGSGNIRLEANGTPDLTI